MSTLLVQKSAIISPCGTWRYELRRVWDDSLPPFVLGMLNPSKADGEVDDPTIIRGWRRAERVGCGSLIVWNLGAGRATDPKIWMRMADPIGPRNYFHIESILTECRARTGVAVVGWGRLGSWRSLDRIALGIAAKVGVTFKCLGETSEGQPRHPLYIANDQPLVDWPLAA